MNRYLILLQSVANEGMAGIDDVLADPETQEALSEFDFLVSESGEGAGEARSHGDGPEWGNQKKSLIYNSVLFVVLVFEMSVDIVAFLLFSYIQLQ